jgi:hypothetical protein
MTTDMNKRKKIHDTHTFHKHTVVYYKLFECPQSLENCVRSMLYSYRYRDKKDFYQCSLNIIKKAIMKCRKSIDCIKSMGKQNGGFISDINNLKLTASVLKLHIDCIDDELTVL